MTPADRKDFLEVIIGFAELKGKQLSAPALELYWRSMQAWSLDDFRKAAEHLIRTCEFMPMPKDFEDLRKAGRATSGEAWAAVLKFARTSYSPNFPVDPRYLRGPLADPLVQRAVNAVGGWNAIAMSNSESTHFLERRFAEHFESMSDSVDIREAVPEIAYSGTRSLQGPQSARSLLAKVGDSQP